MSLWKTGFFRNLSLRGVVTLTFNWFPMRFWNPPQTFIKRLISLGHFNFGSEFPEFLGLAPLETATQLFYIMILDLPRYASNVWPSSEFQNYLFWCKFANTRRAEFDLVSGIVGLMFKCCPSWFLDSLRLSLFSAKICIWKENGPLETLKVNIFSHFRQLITSDLTLVSVSELEYFFIRRMRLK